MNISGVKVGSQNQRRAVQVSADGTGPTVLNQKMCNSEPCSSREDRDMLIERGVHGEQTDHGPGEVLAK